MPSKYTIPLKTVVKDMNLQPLQVPAASIPFSIGGNKTGDLSSPFDELEDMPPSKFVIVKNIMLIHTQENID